MLGLNVDQADISMSQAFDGYTVHMTQQQRARVMDIHSRRRRNFHLTQAIAVLLYQECSRRFGEESPEYREMMSFDNRVLVARPNPQNPSQSLRVPAKIFRTCELLDIVIPRCEFNNFDGYIVLA